MTDILALIVSGLSLVATLLLKGAQKKAALDLQTEAAQVQAFDLFNPATWGAVGANITQVPEAIGAWIRFQAITVAMYTVAVGGALLSAYLLWIEFIGGPTPAEIAARAARLAPVGRAVEVGERAVGVAERITAPKREAETNPVSFERGTRARAVRDVLAKRIEKAGGAIEPFAVATARVKDVGPAKAAKGLPKAEIQKELREQKAEVK